MVKFFCLASGSSGNCYFIENNTQLLIDAGLSFKQTNLKLEQKGYDINDVSGLFLTHEHTDHIKSANLMSKRIDLDIFSKKETLANVDSENLKYMKFNKKVEVGDFKIKPIETSHDCSKPCGFVFESDNKKIGIITDTGIITNDIKKSLKNLNALVIEANHDTNMLINGRYPAFLKKRISSNLGHLSNEDAGLLILENASDNLENIFLAHLSQNNNHPQTAFNTVESIIKQRKDLKNVKIHMTDRFNPTELFYI